MLVRGKPVDQVALRDHILVLQRQGAELAEANPLADRVTVVAGKLHDGGHVDHVRVTACSRRESAKVLQHSKSVVPHGTVGSNPTRSAIKSL